MKIFLTDYESTHGIDCTGERISKWVDDSDSVVTGVSKCMSICNKITECAAFSYDFNAELCILMYQHPLRLQKSNSTVQCYRKPKGCCHVYLLQMEYNCA